MATNPKNAPDQSTDAPTADQLAAVAKLPAVTISGSISAVHSEAVEDFRWSNRMKRAEVVKEAVAEWCEKRGLVDAATAKLAEGLDNTE